MQNVTAGGREDADERSRWEKAAMTATRQLSLMERGHPFVCVRGHNALLYSLPSATFVFRSTNADKN